MEMITWLNALATPVIAAATILYAYFTWGIWKETRDSAKRTEELAKQTRDTLKLNLLAVYLEELRAIPLPNHDPSATVLYAELRAEVVTRILRDGFPEFWGEIMREHLELIDAVRGARRPKE